jgi:ABC-2 type transport system permease protein
LKRDRITFAMIMACPSFSLFFGYDQQRPETFPPRSSPRTRASSRAASAAMKNTDYFTFKEELRDEDAARGGAARARSSSSSISCRFHPAAQRGERPAILVEADATDPAGAGPAIASLQGLAAFVAQKDLAARWHPREDAAVRDTRSPSLQPRGRQAVQHRAGLDGHHPHDDHGDDDGAGHDARAGARHH